MLDDNLSNGDEILEGLINEEVSELNIKLNSSYDYFTELIFNTNKEEKCLIEVKPCAGGKESLLFSQQYLDYFHNIANSMNWDVIRKNLNDSVS